MQDNACHENHLSIVHTFCTSCVALYHLFLSSQVPTTDSFTKDSHCFLPIPFLQSLAFLETLDQETHQETLVVSFVTRAFCFAVIFIVVFYSLLSVCQERKSIKNICHFGI